MILGLALGKSAVVASDAATGDAIVVHLGAGKRQCSLVAGLTRRRCRKLPVRFSDSRGAVVARGATRGDAGMVEAGP